MTTRKRLFVAACISVMAISCAKQNGEEYFPRKVGSRWEYNWQSNRPNKFGATKSRKAIILDSEVTLGEKKYYKWVQVFTDMPGLDVEPSYERLDKNGIYYVRDAKQPDKGEILVWTFPFVPGASGSYITALDTVAKWKVESAGTVHLIDKKYDDCLRITNDVFDQKGEKLFTYTYYYAPKVGRIKQTHKATNGFESEEVLVKYDP